MIEPPRSLEQRTADVLARLRGDVDLWVASADADGDAYLVPLSFVWDGAAVTFATPRSSRTARNLVRAGSARVALGLTRDVVMLDGVVEAIAIGTDPALEEAHAAATGFDPRAEPEEYVYLRITPREIQAWREANELSGRKVMRAGRWLAEAQAPPDVP
ncbi:MAG: pyridoxamine 5'-phosphate oxidase family protein [Gaiella sp.]|jgi:nitroimidazol reductase NimA-like FMN-containing flavoprotein (pyridoxamine 5'-phosphate oxidase superfamily)|uniref:pyridoxamine 5'-phosphate oxidase family protein n=1 Tax=Gaiella sp. TaxID=2663207 RepID=UPI002D1D1B0E|nr:pyridoxamine 5'-phosphate oxidase family protein [Gaiella sp.]